MLIILLNARLFQAISGKRGSLIMTNKINFADFSDKNVVSGLERTLILDKSQFEGLPQGKIKLDGVKISLVDNDNKSTNIENVRYYEFNGTDVAQIDAINSVKGLSEALKKQMIANVPRVYFRVLINDRDGNLLDNAQENFEFITSNSLDTASNNKVLDGLNWAVTWQYLDSYHNILSLVVLSLKGVKVTLDK